MDRDVMAAALLLRICLQGTLSILNDIAPSGRTPEISFSAALKKSAAKAIPGLQLKSFSTAEIFKSADLLQRPSMSFGHLLERTLVLCLLAIGLLERSGNETKDKELKIEAGYGVLSGGGVNIAIAGRPTPKLVKGLLSAAPRKTEIPVRFVSLGDWVKAGKGYLPIACSSAEAELLLSSHAIHSVVAGTGADPGVIETARKMNIPVAAEDGKADPAKILRTARQFHGRSPLPEVTLARDLVGDGMVSAAVKEFTGSGKNKSKNRFALLGGSDSLHYPLGHLPVELATALRGKGFQVAGWGDAAVWMIKSGMASGKDTNPVYILDPHQGPVQVLQSLVLTGKKSRLSGICFTGSRDCRDLPVALGLALLGCNVAVADSIPFWGSSNVRDRLKDLLAANGGRLTGFDHPVEAQELLEWIAR